MFQRIQTGSERGDEKERKRERERERERETEGGRKREREREGKKLYSNPFFRTKNIWAMNPLICY